MDRPATDPPGGAHKGCDWLRFAFWTALATSAGCAEGVALTGARRSVPLARSGDRPWADMAVVVLEGFG